MKKTSDIKIESSNKNKVQLACVKWTVTDLVPFSVGEGEGFKDVVQVFLEIGQKYGKFVDIEYMLPHRTSTTLSKNVSKLF